MARLLKIFKMAISFISAFITYAIHGKDVDFDDYIKRLETCSRCKHINKETQTCKKCGCILPLKAHILNQECEMWDK